MFKLKDLSKEYQVRLIEESDVEKVYDLCKQNPQYYQYCPPFVTMDSIRADMAALPPKKTMEDKYYMGFFRQDVLVAVMDLILKYPNEKTAFIGFFMVNVKFQGKGIGTAIIEEAEKYLKSIGFDYIRLGFAKGNPQSENFWTKNGFERTGVEAQNEGYVVVVLQKILDVI